MGEGGNDIRSNALFENEKGTEYFCIFDEQHLVFLRGRRRNTLKSREWVKKMRSLLCMVQVKIESRSGIPPV